MKKLMLLTAMVMVMVMVFTSGSVVSAQHPKNFHPRIKHVCRKIATSIIISVSPDSIDFGTVTMARTLDQNVTISNSSSSNANLTGSVGISAMSRTGFSIVSGSGSFNLSPGQSKTVTVRFATMSAIRYEGFVSITHNATNTATPITVLLSGIEISSAEFY